MATYRVIETSINIHSGVLVLEPPQVEPRKHRLTHLGENRYSVSNPPVQFKRGEVFDLEGDLPKELVHGTQAEGFSKVQPVIKKPVIKK